MKSFKKNKYILIFVITFLFFVMHFFQESLKVVYWRVRDVTNFAILRLIHSRISDNDSFFASSEVLKKYYLSFYQNVLADLRHEIENTSYFPWSFQKNGSNNDENDKLEKLKLSECLEIDKPKKIYTFAGINPYASLYMFSKLSMYSLQLPKNTIPQTLHYIWSTPTGVKNSKIANKITIRMQYNIDLLSKGWQVYIWTNNPDSMPKELTLRSNVKVMSYGSIFPEYQKTFSSLEKRKEFLSPLSDLVRYLVLDRFGGVYIDVDYRLCKPIDDLIQKYDFIFGKESKMYGAGGFVASAKGHTIAQHMIKSISKNLSRHSADLYVVKACNHISFISMAMGPVALNIEFYKYANLGGNKDVMLPPDILLSVKYAQSVPCSIPESGFCSFLPDESYGNDAYSGSWTAVPSINSNNSFCPCDFYDAIE